MAEGALPHCDSVPPGARVPPGAERDTNLNTFRHLPSLLMPGVEAMY